MKVPERARHVETEVIPAKAVLLVRPHLWDLAGPTPSSENIREKSKKSHRALSKNREFFSYTDQRGKKTIT
jgi:hypothetical protein